VRSRVISYTVSLITLCALLVERPARLEARPKTKWERQAEQLERVRALRRAKRRAQRYRKAERAYQAAGARERAGLMKTLVEIDEAKALKLISAALKQREDMTLRTDALLALRVAQPGALKTLVIKSMLSPYVYERKALAQLLTSWGKEEGEAGLRELALDKSVSVRRMALEGLSEVGGGLELLRSYALDALDEGTAMVSARAWVDSEREGRGQQAERIKIELALLGSNFREARTIGVKRLIQEGEAACAPLTEATFAERGEREALDQANLGLWSSCQGHLLNQALSGSPHDKVTLFEGVARWGVQSPKLSRLIGQQLKHPSAEVRVALAHATSRADEAPLRFERLDQLRLDPEVTVRCAALEGLIPPPQEEESRALTLPSALKEELIKQLSEELKAHIPQPQPERAWLVCSLEAIARLGSADFDVLLTRAYTAWRRSIINGPLRRKLVEAATRSPGPAKLEVLMEGMLDPDPEVKRLSEEALRRRPR